MPEIIPEPIRRKTATVPQVDAAMYGDMQKKVHCFLALINWWQKTQIASHSERLTLELVAQSLLAEDKPVVKFWWPLIILETSGVVAVQVDSYPAGIKSTS